MGMKTMNTMKSAKKIQNQSRGSIRPHLLLPPAVVCSPPAPGPRAAVQQEQSVERAPDGGHPTQAARRTGNPPRR
jgi:hypothetical protein